jgi:hypothetical protein
MSLKVNDLKQPSNFFWIIVISGAIAALWLIPGLVILMQGEGSGSGAWGLLTVIAIPATVIAPLVYGWDTRDTIGAVIIGLLPFLLVMGISGTLSGNIPGGSDHLAASVLYIVSLSLVGGVEGFLAAKKNLKSLVVGIFLAGVWIGIFLSGIN